MIVSREFRRMNTNWNPVQFVSLRVHSGLALILLLLVFVVGCRSRVIQVTLINTSAQPLSNIIVDYPGATFGKNTLMPGETYHYVIKPTESGDLKIQFTNAAGASRNFSGPRLHKDEEGSIEIKLNQESASASPAFM